MTELKRLALALCPVNCDTACEDCVDDIRAILEALKEPTGNMVRAGNSAGVKATWRTVTTDVWQAMISAILEEPE